MHARGIRRSSTAALTLLLLGAPLAAQQTVRLPQRDRPLSERPADVFAIGREEGRSWEMFSGVRGVAFDRADNLYVLDGQNTRVVVFDAGGRFVREFGRRGSGPGELQAPTGIAVTSDGSVVLADLANRAFVLFTPAGEYIRNVPFSNEAGMPTAMQADPRGGVLTRASPLRMSEPTGPGDNVARILRQPLTAVGEPSPMLSFAITPPQVIQTGSGDTRGMVRISAEPVFSARASFGVLPDGGIALHKDAEYSVLIHDGSGNHIRTIEREYRLRKVTKKDQEAYEERREQARASGADRSNSIVINMNGSGGSAPPAGAMPQLPFSVNTTFAAYMSAITTIRTDPLGRLWIQRRHEDGTDRGPIDLVDAGGRYIGTLPPQQLPTAVSASGLAAWVIRDDMDVERVVVRRLPTAWH
jgi:hypothetical protein